MISVILTSPDPSSQPSFADLTRFTAVHLHGPLRIDGPPRCGGHSALEIQVGAYHDSSRPLAVLNFHDSDLQPNLKPRRRPKLRQTGPDPRAGPTQWATADAVLRLLTAGRWAHLGVAATTHADAGSYFGLGKPSPRNSAIESLPNAPVTVPCALSATGRRCYMESWSIDHVRTGTCGLPQSQEQGC